MLSELLKDEIPNGRFWTRRWHLVSGCKEVSPGCRGCWMRAEARLRERHPHPSVRMLHEGLLTDDGKAWNGTVRCNEHLLELPMKTKKPQVWAVWSDLFHEAVPNGFRSRALVSMALAPRHRFIIVTKRPENAARYLGIGNKDLWQGHLSTTAFRHYGEEADCQVHNAIEGCLGEGRNVGWPLRNVIILVTIEDRERFNQRSPFTMKLAHLGWNVGVLAEPLLSGINLCLDIWPVLPRWIITGGETGTVARPAHPDWFLSLRDQAQGADVPFLFKAWGEWAPCKHGKEVTPHAGYIAYDLPHGQLPGPCDRRGCWGPESLEKAGCAHVQRIGKKAAGRILDGQEYNEVPNI